MAWIDILAESRAHQENAEFWEVEYYRAVKEFAGEVNGVIAENRYLKKQLRNQAKRMSQLEAENWHLKTNRRKGL